MENIFVGTYVEVLNIKGLLESNGISTFLLNENMAVIEPVISSGGFNSAILQVRSEDFDYATKLLQEYGNGIS